MTCYLRVITLAIQTQHQNFPRQTINTEDLFSSLFVLLISVSFFGLEIFCRHVRFNTIIAPKHRCYRRVFRFWFRFLLRWIILSLWASLLSSLCWVLHRSLRGWRHACFVALGTCGRAWLLVRRSFQGAGTSPPWSPGAPRGHVLVGSTGHIAPAHTRWDHVGEGLCSPVLPQDLPCGWKCSRLTTHRLLCAP